MNESGKTRDERSGDQRSAGLKGGGNSVSSAAVPAMQKTARVLLAGAMLLVIAGLMAFYFATRFARQAHESRESAADVVTVEVGAHECSPNELTVAAGLSTFRIVNMSARAVEWEILDGVMVVEERENIAPGFSQVLSAQLAPGDYDITCGLLSNPRGKLHVTPTAQSDNARKAAPSLTDFVGPLSEYRVYLTLQSISLVSAVQALDQAIVDNDTAAAKTAYGDAHRIYMHFTPIADLFSDLDKRLDAPADFFDQREKDVGFTGFHRLEYGLFAPGADASTAALAAHSRQLMKDTDALRQRMDELSIQPRQLGVAAARRLDLIATTIKASNEEAHASMGPGDIAPAIDGVREIVGLLKPLLAQTSPALVATLSSDLDATAALAKSAVDPAKSDATFADLDATRREQLAAKLMTLAADLRRVNPALGLN